MSFDDIIKLLFNFCDLAAAVKNAHKNSDIIMSLNHSHNENQQKREDEEVYYSMKFWAAVPAHIWKCWKHALSA